MAVEHLKTALYVWEEAVPEYKPAKKASKSWQSGNPWLYEVKAGLTQWAGREVGPEGLKQQFVFQRANKEGYR